jgi:hypothetical protein
VDIQAELSSTLYQSPVVGIIFENGKKKLPFANFFKKQNNQSFIYQIPIL